MNSGGSIVEASADGWNDSSAAREKPVIFAVESSREVFRLPVLDTTVLAMEDLGFAAGSIAAADFVPAFLMEDLGSDEGAMAAGVAPKGFS